MTFWHLHMLCFGGIFAYIYIMYIFDKNSELYGYVEFCSNMYTKQAK